MIATKMRGRRIGRGEKYGNKRIKTNHGTFDSEAEAERFSVLLGWQDEGRVANLRQGERITLQPGFRDMHGKAWQAWTYTPDFLYTVPEYGIEVMEDFKGRRPPEWSAKERRIRYRWPDVHFFVNEDLGGWYIPPAETDD